jgi:hypothetical protein
MRATWSFSRGGPRRKATRDPQVPRPRVHAYMPTPPPHVQDPLGPGPRGHAGSGLHDGSTSGVDLQPHVGSVVARASAGHPSRRQGGWPELRSPSASVVGPGTQVRRPPGEQAPMSPHSKPVCYAAQWRAAVNDLGLKRGDTVFLPPDLYTWAHRLGLVVASPRGEFGRAQVVRIGTTRE